MKRRQGERPQGKRPVISKRRRRKVSTSEKKSQQEPPVDVSGGGAVAGGSSDTGRAQGANMWGARQAPGHAKIVSTAPRTHTTAARTHTIFCGRSTGRSSDEDMTSGKKDEPPYKIEEQFILRLPPEQAYALRRNIHSRSVPMKDKLKIDFSSDGRHADVQVEDVPLSAKLVDLPCAIGSLKSIDRKTFYQTADISQMLVCSASGGPSTIDPLAARSDKKEADKKYMWKHGITPPLKNVRKKRFRKVTEKSPETKQTDEINSGENIHSPDVEKEVKRLLYLDAEAIKVQWEVIGNEETKEIESQGCISGLPVTPKGDPISPVSGIQKLIDSKKIRLQEIRRKAQRQRDLLRDLKNPTLTSHFRSVLGQLNIKEKQVYDEICYLHAQLTYFMKEDRPRSGT